MDVLAPDVVLVTDGGGVKQAALRPILGRRQGAALPRRRCSPEAPAVPRRRASIVNGAPALRICLDGEVDTIASMLVEDGLVTGALLSCATPHKLRPRWTRWSPLDPVRLERARVGYDVSGAQRQGSTPRCQTGDQRAESAEQPQTLRTCSG